MAYLEAFRQLHPHRLVSPEDMPFQEVMGQSLVHSRQITHHGQPIAWEHRARQGRITAKHSRDLFFSFLFFLLGGRKKAYMPIDANHVSKVKDR